MFQNFKYFIKVLLANVKEIDLLVAKYTLRFGISLFNFSSFMLCRFKFVSLEFTKNNNLYIMKLFDPLGNVWYEGSNIKECSQALIYRLNFIKRITRESTVSSEENIGALAWFFNMFKEEIYKSENNPVVPIKSTFLNIVKQYASKFAEATFETKDVKRFLGNASFRCPKGFPSFREGNYIFVSKRNVNKEFIGIDDFVPVYLEDGKIYYCGNSKPSVDTPIQVRLYELLPNINYMIHSHCYIKEAPFTEKVLLCGAIEEVEEILKLLEKNYYDDFYIINLIGHGSIMMSKNLEQLKNINIIGRKLPEYMNEKSC